MKAILIDPFERSLETIDVKSGNTPEALMQLQELVGDHLDFAYVLPGESIAVGDHSALQNPPLPHYRIGTFLLYGCGVVLGYRIDGSQRETSLTVDDWSKLIEFQ